MNFRDILHHRVFCQFYHAWFCSSAHTTDGAVKTVEEDVKEKTKYADSGHIHHFAGVGKEEINDARD